VERAGTTTSSLIKDPVDIGGEEGHNREGRDIGGEGWDIGGEGRESRHMD
jgi:hypothetical protein